MSDFETKFYDDNGNSFSPDLEFTEDGVEKSLVEHEYPFTNGADLEDMGAKARVITMRAYFTGALYDSHKTFLEWLKQSNTSRHFLHPKYGLITGDVKKVMCRHDDQKETVTIDITFVENGAQKALPSQKLAVAEAVQTAAVTSAMNRLAWLTDALGSAQKKYSAVKQQVTAYQNKIAAASATFTATLSAVSNPATSFTSLINWASDVPGTLVLSSAQAVERYAVAYQTLKSAPANFINKLDSAFRTLENSFAAFNSGSAATIEAGFAVQLILKLACAEALAVAVADVFGQEQDLRDTLSAAEGLSPVDANGEFVQQVSSTDESDTTVVSSLMTTDEMENTLALARAYLQEAIEAARAAGLDAQSYKDLALALESHVNDIKLQREQIVEIELDQPLPLHLVCLRYGLPHNAAERLMTLNPAVQNPNRTEGAVNIYNEVDNA